MAQPLGTPYSYFADSNGAPLAGGKIYTYVGGTVNTPQATYTDATLGTPLANPVILDSAGRSTIWLSGTYKIVVKDSADNTISTTDNITAISNSGDMMKSVYDAANVGEQLVGVTAVQTLTNKTLTSPTLTTPLTTANGGTGVGVSDPIIQRLSTQTGAVATGTVVIPADDTIPQNTEGDQYLTLAITPKNSANILVIDAIVNISNSAVGQMAIALFQDSTANALAVCGADESTSGRLQSIRLKHTMTAGTTSATTFKIRAGNSAAGTTTFNGAASARFYGGVIASSITITEYAS